MRKGLTLGLISAVLVLATAVAASVAIDVSEAPQPFSTHYVGGMDEIPQGPVAVDFQSGFNYVGDLPVAVVEQGGPDASGLAAASYSPEVFRTVEHIYGLLPPSTYKSYSIAYTIAICVDIEWLPRQAWIYLGLLNTTTNIVEIWGFRGGELYGWCPSTDGADEFLVLNLYWRDDEVYIIYDGNLTKIYW